MCFVAMLVARSPPVSADFLSNCSSYRLSYEPPSRSYIRPRQLSPQPSPPPLPLQLDPPSTSLRMPVAVPRRPCLVVRPEDASSSSDENELQSPTRLKKKVVFADDKGLSLTQVSVFCFVVHATDFFSLRLSIL
jgi:protein phosphatase 1 regulatory subunit 3A/B/C/D/E